jgi:hypothetical protein
LLPRPTSAGREGSTNPLRWRISFATIGRNRTSPASKLPSPSAAHISSPALQFSQKRSLVATSRPPTLSLQLTSVTAPLYIRAVRLKNASSTAIKLSRFSSLPQTPALLHSTPFRTFLPASGRLRASPQPQTSNEIDRNLREVLPFSHFYKCTDRTLKDVKWLCLRCGPGKHRGRRIGRAWRRKENSITGVPRFAISVRGLN